MNTNPEFFPEDVRLIADLNDPGMAGAFEIMRRLRYLQQEGPNKQPQTAVAIVMETGQSAVSEMLNCEVMPGLHISVRLAHALGATLQVVHPLERPYTTYKFNYPSPDEMRVVMRSTPKWS